MKRFFRIFETMDTKLRIKYSTKFITDLRRFFPDDPEIVEMAENGDTSIGTILLRRSEIIKGLIRTQKRYANTRVPKFNRINDLIKTWQTEIADAGIIIPLEGN